MCADSTLTGRARGTVCVSHVHQFANSRLVPLSIIGRNAFGIVAVRQLFGNLFRISFSDRNDRLLAVFKISRLQGVLQVGQLIHFENSILLIVSEAHAQEMRDLAMVFYFDLLVKLLFELSEYCLVVGDEQQIVYPAENHHERVLHSLDEHTAVRKRLAESHVDQLSLQM